MINLKHRDELGEYLNFLGLAGIGAEIGCARGDYARKVLADWKGEKYLMVDPWKNQPAEVYKERQPLPSDYSEWWDTVQMMAQHDKRIQLMRSLSTDAAQLIENESLDFVYLDGNHSFKSVLDDLDAWWPKLKDQGLMGGHDFCDKIDGEWYCQVASAVVAWCTRRHKKFILTPCTSWWIHKI